MRLDHGLDVNVTVARASLRVRVGGVGVLEGSVQASARETRDRAERGSVVRGSDQRASLPKRIPTPPTRRARRGQRGGTI